jgi:hypothetical protein
LNTQNTSYGQKKGWKLNWQFDSQLVKVGNRPNFLLWRWCMTYCWKFLDKGYNFSLNLISIGGPQTKLWAPKVARIPTSGISGLPLGVSGQNAIWALVPWLGTKYTIRGKVVASPKSGLWWILWVSICSWLILAPKVLKLCTNQFVVWFV